MIKTYKQWMQTIHESVQEINEAKAIASDGVTSLFSGYQDFLYSCIVGGDGVAGNFEKELQAMASGVIAKGASSSAFSFDYDAESVKAEIGEANEYDGKPEVTNQSGAFKFLKLDKGVSTNVTLPSENKSFAMKNASGNYVPIRGQEDNFSSNFATNIAGHADIKGLLMNLNFRNMEMGFTRIKHAMKNYTSKLARKNMGMEGYSTSGAYRDMLVLKSVKNSLQLESLKNVNSIDGVLKADLLKNTKADPKYDDLKSITQVIPLYVTTKFEGNGGNEIDSSKMVPKSITTVIKGEVTTKENSIPGGDDLFQQGSASPKGDVLAGLKSELGKMVEQYDGIKSIVVTGGASFEWQGGERNDAENRKLSESRAQSIAGILKGLYPKIAGVVVTAGAEKAKIQPDEDKTKVEEYRKVYIQITGHNIGDDTEKVASFEEIKNSTWNKDKWTIKCYWMAITMINQNVVTKEEYEADLATYGKKTMDGHGRYKVID